jgi:hypothetical protein
MCVDVALSKECLDGKAKVLMDHLDQKFWPNTGYKCEDLCEKLRSIRVKEDDDPNDTFEKIAGIRNLARELGGTAKIEDAEVIARLFQYSLTLYTHTTHTTHIYIYNTQL